VAGKQRTIYLDESGALGFSGGGSQFLVIGFLSARSRYVIPRVIRDMKQRLGIPSSEELKGHALRRQARTKVLRALSQADLSIHAIVVKKAGVHSRLRQNPNVLYNYALQFLIVDHVKQERLSALSLVIDERTQKIVGRGRQLDEYLRHKLWAEEDLDVDLRFHHVQSHMSLGIQAVDVIVNAIARKYERGHTRAYNLISRRIADERRMYF
jgi:hypothetical protein